MREKPSVADSTRNPRTSSINHDREQIKKRDVIREVHLDNEQASYKFYSLLSRLPFPKSYPGKIMLVIFFGTSLPMLTIIFYLLIFFTLSIMATLQILGITLLVTILGTGFTIYTLRLLLSPLTLVSRNLYDYVNDRKLPDLPTHFTDEAGRLMGLTQHTIGSIDNLIQSLEKASITDHLTGAYNRHSGEKRLKEDISRVKRSGGTISLVMLDIDDFKLINDQYGHDTGDVCIKHFVNIMRSNIREGDLLVRWGGDEFLLILFNSDLQFSGKILERICLAIKDQPAQTYQGEIDLTMSVGICEYNGKDSAEIFFKKADSALLLAKRLGKSQIIYYPDSIAQLTHKFVA